ncbi:MAG: multiheme c-type cytochrome [Geobacteraceae bacterium]|nr:multiheme c-type cytochrome [Geobacteraceae bacterium]
MKKTILKISMLCFATALVAGCGSGSGNGSGSTNVDNSSTQRVITPLPASETTPPSGGINNAASASYVVLAWNDLGMHCLNPSYDTAVILPPYNTVFAQVVKRGNPPQLVTTGVTVSYRIVRNTTSQKGLFSQFWTFALQLFGVAPAIDKGLNLTDPAVSNGLTGTMLAKGNHFQVDGIPLTPVNDGNTWTPFQLAEITVTDTATGSVIARTRTTVPTSDEINCGKCHGNSSDPTVVFNDILAKHDASHGTNLVNSKPVLCASCHGSPVLGATSSGSSGIYLSQAIHGFHGRLASPPGCYDCHPGDVTKCNRSTHHTSANGNCTTCHGSIANVAATVANGSRVPWETEPKCVTCHNTGIGGTGVAGVDTGATLYRHATGHGGVYCAGCHGSPHAMVPTGQPTDNYQSVQYQGAAKTIGDCGACHDTSRGGGNDFADEHGSDRLSACNVCHTGYQNVANTANWPHQFQWKSR